MLQVSQLSPKERAARSRLRLLLQESGLIRASWVRLKHPCGGTNCHCARSKRNWHETYYISQSCKGKLRRKSIPKELREQVDRWVKDYWEARDLLDRISEEYWTRLKKPTKAR